VAYFVYQNQVRDRLEVQKAVSMFMEYVTKGSIKPTVKGANAIISAVSKIADKAILSTIINLYDDWKLDKDLYYYSVSLQREL
jgi:hypothetical protein